MFGVLWFRKTSSILCFYINKEVEFLTSPKITMKPPKMAVCTCFSISWLGTFTGEPAIGCHRFTLFLCSTPVSTEGMPVTQPRFIAFWWVDRESRWIPNLKIVILVLTIASWEGWLALQGILRPIKLETPGYLKPPPISLRTKKQHPRNTVDSGLFWIRDPYDGFMK